MSQQLIVEFEGKVKLLYQTAKHDTTIFSPDHELCVDFLVLWKGTTNRELSSLIIEKMWYQ